MSAGSAVWPSRWRSPLRSKNCCRPSTAQSLKGKRVLITSGPTHEPIDPVRYIANRSSGKQGHAIADAAAAAGADVTLVSGPVNVPDPPGVKVVKVETAREMLQAVERALPVDIAIFAAAVADWRVANAGEQKLKKQAGKATPDLSLVENPDILATIAKRKSTATETGHRLCCRDRKRCGQCKGKARQQRLRLDFGQRCFATIRRDGWRPQHNYACACVRRLKPGNRKAKTRSRPCWSRALPIRLEEVKRERYRGPRDAPASRQRFAAAVLSECATPPGSICRGGAGQLRHLISRWYPRARSDRYRDRSCATATKPRCGRVPASQRSTD